MASSLAEIVRSAFDRKPRDVPGQEGLEADRVRVRRLRSRYDLIGEDLRLQVALQMDVLGSASGRAGSELGQQRDAPRAALGGDRPDGDGCR